MHPVWAEGYGMHLVSALCPVVRKVVLLYFSACPRSLQLQPGVSCRPLVMRGASSGGVTSALAALPAAAVAAGAAGAEGASGLDLRDTLQDGARLLLFDAGLRQQLLMAFTQDSRLHVREVRAHRTGLERRRGWLSHRQAADTNMPRGCRLPAPQPGPPWRS